MDKIRGDFEARIEEIGAKIEQDKKRVVDFSKKTEQIIQSLNDQALGELQKIYSQALFNRDHTNGTYWLSKPKFEKIKKLVDERGQELSGLNVSELPESFGENIQDFRLNHTLYKEVFPSVDLFDVFMKEGIIWPSTYARKKALNDDYTTMIVIPSNLDIGEKNAGFKRAEYFEGFFKKEFGSNPFYFSEKSREYDLQKIPPVLPTRGKKFYTIAIRPAAKMDDDEVLAESIGHTKKTMKNFIAEKNRISGFGLMSHESIQGLTLGEYTMFLLNDYINNYKNNSSTIANYAFPDTDIYCNLIQEGYQEGKDENRVEKKLVAKWDPTRNSVELVGDLLHLAVGRTGTRIAYKFHA